MFLNEKQNNYLNKRSSEKELFTGDICRESTGKKIFLSLQPKSRAVGEIEKHHEERYRALLKNIETVQHVIIRRVILKYMKRIIKEMRLL